MIFHSEVLIADAQENKEPIERAVALDITLVF